MASVSDYTFEPLENRVAFGDLMRFERYFGIAIHRRVLVIGFAVFAGVAACVVGLVFVPKVLGDSPAYVQLLVRALVPLWGLSMVFSFGFWVRGRMRDARLAAFANANGLGYSDRMDSSGWQRTRRSGMGFPKNMRNIEQALIGHNEDFPGSFDIARNYITQKEGADRVDLRRPFTFAEVKLPSTVPHIILKNSRSRILPLAGQGLGNRTRLSLEGDFDKYFTLYCPEGYERDALYIFTPDVMAAVVDVASGAEVELVDDCLYIYMKSGTPVWNAGTMRSLLDLIETLTARFSKQTTNYRDDRADAAGRVSLAGRRVAGSDRASQLTWVWMAGVALFSAAVMVFSLFVVPNL